MRNDRRTPLQLQELIKKKVRVNLTSWEKRNIKELYLTELKSKIKENCGSCWLTAIEELSRLEQKEVKPILVKEKMIVHEAPKKEWIEIKPEHLDISKEEAQIKLYDIACVLAKEKGVKKPHPKSGIEKLELFIKNNQ